jgi:DNA mismatch repair protein MutL
MPRIQQLPPLVASQIAAGEVIERPASVVKELLENAVDAGASRIDVEVEGGGAELIRVVDDGCGISASDLHLALASHATSKLACADDLFRIATFGFRGEALASVAAVAQVQLQSRPKDEPLGAEVTCQGGDLSPVRPWNGSSGTRIEVRHLFFNTPVRRKFLKATATEVGHVSEAFTRLALAHSRPVVPVGLHMTLRHNNKAVYDVPASATLLDRLGQFFGPEVAGSLYPVEARQGSAHLHGYIADPACERGTARLQYLFVNGRWVRDRSLGHAVQEAYRGLLMTGRYAVCFLFLELPPDQVDVNVHPTKVEVRFRDSQALHHLVFAAVRDRLRQENLTARLRVTSSLTASADEGPSPPRDPGVPTVSSAPLPDPWQLTAPPSPGPMLPFAAQRPQPVPETVSAPLPSPPQPAVPTAEAVRAIAPLTGKAIQLYDSYLVLETEAGLLVVDQHALHERILYEQFKARLRAGSLETQRLLIPEPIDLTAEQAARTLDQRAALAELGLGVEDFGGGTILLTSYPSILGRRSPQELLRAVVDHLLAKERLPSRDVLFNDLLSLMACHAAVRAGDRLTPEEMSALLDLRQLADDTHHCPHGRPTSLLFSRHDLERQFRRV